MEPEALQVRLPSRLGYPIEEKATVEMIELVLQDPPQQTARMEVNGLTGAASGPDADHQRSPNGYPQIRELKTAFGIYGGLRRTGGDLGIQKHDRPPAGAAQVHGDDSARVSDLRRRECRLTRSADQIQHSVDRVLHVRSRMPHPGGGPGHGAERRIIRKKVSWSVHGIPGTGLSSGRFPRTSS